jgi:hypothetical protein
MARSSDPGTIGKFLWIVALTSVLPTAFDTASLQFLSQKTRNRGIRGVHADQWISSFQISRALVILVITCLQALVFFGFGLLSFIELASLFFASFGSALGSQLTNQLAQAQSRRIFIRYQIWSSAAAATLGVLVFISNGLTLTILLLVYGASKTPPVIYIALRARAEGSRNKFLPMVGRRLSKLKTLLITQLATATNTYLDGALVASFGFTKASSYQLLQRPLLLLSLVNVTIGQEATRSALRGERINQSKILKFALVGSLAGGIFGFASHILLPFLLGRDLGISPTTAITLGVAYGLSSATSLAGPHVLLAMKNRSLLISSVGQIFIIGFAFLSLQNLIGLTSLAIGVFLAKVFALLVQLRSVE